MAHGDKFYYWNWDTGKPVWKRPADYTSPAESGGDESDSSSSSSGSSSSSSSSGSDSDSGSEDSDTEDDPDIGARLAGLHQVVKRRVEGMTERAVFQRNLKARLPATSRGFSRRASLSRNFRVCEDIFTSP